MRRLCAPPDVSRDVFPEERRGRSDARRVAGVDAARGERALVTLGVLEREGRLPVSVVRRAVELLTARLLSQQDKTMAYWLLEMLDEPSAENADSIALLLAPLRV